MSTKPILFEQNERDYHAAQALSAGGAWLLANECPALYWHQAPFNPKAEPIAATKEMDLGTAVHLAGLEPKRLATRTRLVDAGDWKTKAAREARDEARDSGLVPLLPKDMAVVATLRDALFRNRHAAELLDGAQTEVSYFWTAGGVPLKARADIISKERREIGDLKISASASPRFFERQAFSLGHFLRVPWYVDGWLAASGKAAVYWFIVVARDPPHLVTVCRLDERAIAWGRQMIRRSLVLFKHCTAVGRWPGYAEERVTLGLPTYAEYQLADREQAGDFSATMELYAP